MEKATDVNQYILQASEEAQVIMKELRSIIQTAVPKAEERIAWNVPNYTLNGVLTGFAAYAKHVSIGFSEGGLSEEERSLFETNGFKTGKGTVQIKFGQEVPSKIIKQVLLRHAQLNAAKS